MTERRRQFLRLELEKLPEFEFTNGEEGCRVICPFHNDTRPSGNINLDPLEERAPIGWFRCWSCSASCHWDEYAKTVGLRPLDGKRTTSDDYVDPAAMKERLYEEKLQYKLELKRLELFDDFPFETWRDVPVKTLKAVGCKYAFYDKTGDFYVWFPVFVKGKLKGYLRAMLEKSDDPDAISYINAPGRWSNKYGLLYFDYSVELMKKLDLKTIVLVEGPRDGLRLIQNKIPAMSVLGAVNFGEDKMLLLEQEGVENVIIFMDGDKAGKKATKHIYNKVKGHFSMTKFVKLWDLQPGADPFNCDQKFVDRVKSALR